MAHPNGPSETDHTYEENGRHYGTYKRGAYLLPVDATERDRLDILHTMIKTARDSPNRLINAPTYALIRPRGETGERARVLDLGCGTGIWLLEMAEEYPEAEFLGVDINAMGPDTLLSNVDIVVPWDMESPWALGEGMWDIIHLQLALGAIQNWPSIYRKIQRHLRPGTGWYESVEIDWKPRCDDGTLRPGILTEWWEHYVCPAFKDGHCPIAYNENTTHDLHVAGFRDIQHRVYRVPLNGWPKVKAQHRTGMWWNIAMSSGHEGSGGYGMEALSLAVLTRVFEWNADHARRLCAEALQQASNQDHHVYNELHIYWARAPYPHER